RRRHRPARPGHTARRRAPPRAGEGEGRSLARHAGPRCRWSVRPRRGGDRGRRGRRHTPGEATPMNNPAFPLEIAFLAVVLFIALVMLARSARIVSQYE